MKFETPILFLIFNRPDTTQQVFDVIKKIKHNKLYIAADGPRENRDGEREKCEQTRNIIKQIDWECEIKTLFQDKNLGCKIGVSSAIDWFFENEEMGIIFEDDCLPDQSFFNFCQELLEKYKNDDRIMMISGDNFQNGIMRGNSSYYFSKNSHIWGWASWRKAWNKYDVNMSTHPDFKKNNQIKNIFKNIRIQEYWISIFDSVFSEKIDTWDYQWTYAIWANDGLSIIPNVNLISNIGFRDDATHTVGKYNERANVETKSIGKIIHPAVLIQNKEADEFEMKKIVFPSKISRIFNGFCIIYRIIIKK